MTLSRNDIRQKAFQALFAMTTIEGTDREAVIQELLPVAETGGVIPEYFMTLVDGVLANKPEIDQLISQSLSTGWTIKRIAKTDLIIMEIALFEIQHVDDVPDSVAVNEALEIAKRFSDDQSRKFINGVLGNFVKK